MAHANAPWYSTARLVADVPIQVEGDPKDQMYASLAATKPVSIISTNTGTSNLVPYILQQQNSSTSLVS